MVKEFPNRFYLEHLDQVDFNLPNKYSFDFLSIYDNLPEAKDAEWKESEHPRIQAGGSKGGQFTKAGGAGAGGKRTPEAGGELPQHIVKLRIPPAWTDVSYNEDPDGDLLVTGRDAKGRQQTIYSERFSKTQAEAKFRRIEELNNKFKQIQAENDENRKNPKTRDLANVLSLIMATGIRPGSEDDTLAAKKAYGATTLEGRHVVVSPSGEVRLQFVGKKGVDIDIPVSNSQVSSMLRIYSKRAGPSGQLFPGVSAGRLLSYVHGLDGGSFKTKDFRTLLGTSIAQKEVMRYQRPKDAKIYKKMVMAVAKKVSEALGNTPTIALQSYIAPEVFARWRMSAHV